MPTTHLAMAHTIWADVWETSNVPVDVRSDAVKMVEDVFNACNEEVVQRMVEAKKTTLEKAKSNIVEKQN